jgi:hypothetical protein
MSPNYARVQQQQHLGSSRCRQTIRRRWTLAAFPAFGFLRHIVNLL